jgi:hypothetical protein
MTDALPPENLPDGDGSQGPSGSHAHDEHEGSDLDRQGEQEHSGSDEQPHTIPYEQFERALSEETVSLLELVRANTLRYSTDPDQNVVGEHYYLRLSAAFMAANPEAQVAVQAHAGLGACLPGGSNPELELLTIQRTIRFDWSEPRLLEGDLILLEDEAKRWLGLTDRRSLQLMLFTIAVQMQTCIANENRRHPTTASGVPPTPELQPELAVVREKIAGAKARLAEDAPRAAEVIYAAGMGIGAALLGILCGIIAAVFISEHISAANGVALLAGGIGACLSVLQRMTFPRKGRKLALDYRVGKKMLITFGAVRPFVGGTFGMVTFCAIRSGLLSGTLVIPTATGALLAFYAFFGFVAGFNERFFQDMLRTASPTFGGDSHDDASAGGTSP